MKVEKTIRYKKKVSTLDTIQYIISLITALCFGIGLIPFAYIQIFFVLIPAIVIQIVISLVRLRLLNVLLELLILFLAVISLIPVLGYLSRAIGILASILDMVSYKNYQMYKEIEIRTFGEKGKKIKKKTIKGKGKFKEAEFKEK